MTLIPLSPCMNGTMISCNKGASLIMTVWRPHDDPVVDNPNHEHSQPNIVQAFMMYMCIGD